MGFNIQSSDTSETLNDFTSVVNSSVEKAKNSVQTTCTAANNLVALVGSIPVFQNGVPTGTPIVCATNIEGSVNINQLADANCNLTGDFTTTFQNNLTTNVQNDVQQWIQQNLQSNQGWLAIAFDGQFSESQTAASVATTISNSLVADITNTCSAQLEASNNGLVSICGNYKRDFNFNQSAFVTNVTSCIANNTVSFISGNTVLNNMAQHADTTLSSSQEGLSTIFKWLIVGAIAIVVLIIIAVLMFFIFGSKGGSTPQTDLGKEQIKAGLEKRIFAAKNPDLAGLEKSAETRTGAGGTGGAFSRLADRVRKYGTRAAEAEV